MARPTNPNLTKYWKVCLPATLAGTVELYLMDRIHGKPRYGARAELLEQLLSGWVKEQQALRAGRDPLTDEAKEIAAAITAAAPNTDLIAVIANKLETLRAGN